jgi:tetratricopeptide (TPR) repeat protein
MLRIGDHVRGPFETEAVKSLILSNKVSEIDEIALPCKSWSYVRDRSDFAETLKSLRSSSFTKSNNDSLTSSYTGTENITDSASGEKTQELTSANMTDTHTTPLSDFDNLELQKATLDIDKIKSTARAVPNPNASKSNSRLFIMILFVASICGGGYLYSTNQLNYNPMALLNQDYTEKFNSSWESGDYTDALKHLKAQKSLVSKNRLKYSVLLLLKGNDFVSAEAALDQVENKSSADWKNVKGLIEFKSGRFDSAESLFLSALEQNAAYVPSLVNLGLLKRHNKDWENARFYFESAYSNSTELVGQEEISFYLVESWLQQIMKKDGLTQIEEVRAFLKNRLIGKSTFSHELQMIDIWINTLKGSWDESEDEVLKRFVELDPFIIFERKRNPYFHRLKEGELSYICEGFGADLVSENFKKTALGLCYSVNKQYNKAIRTLGVVSNEHEMSLQSFVYRAMGDDLKADESLVVAMEQTKNESIVKYFLQARFCFNSGDMKCSAEYWKKALDLDQEAFTAHTGLARAYYEVDDMLRARTFLDRAKVFTSSYGPLIELQNLMKNKSE